MLASTLRSPQTAHDSMRIRIFTTEGAWALGDQILSSATNFAAGVVVARTIGPAGYGSFTLAFGSWVILLGATRAMLVQPYTVVASGTSAQEWQSATRSTAAAVLGFGIVFAVVAVAASVVLGTSTPTGGAFLALGIFAGPLALQDFWRFAAFSQTAPRAAAFNDGVWAIVQAISLAALLATHTLTPATAVGSWGLGALAGALFGLRQFRLRPWLGPMERKFMRQNAGLAGWYGLASAAYQAGSYGAVLLVGAGVGPAALGGLGSTNNLLAPARLVASSGESLLLPIVARAARQEERDALRRICSAYSLGFAAFFALAGGALILVGPMALRFLFGSKYEGFSPLIAPVVAAAAISGLASGLVLGFRALAEGRMLAGLQTASSVAKILIVAVSLPFGLLAIAWGLAAAEVVRTALAWGMFRQAVARRYDGESRGAQGGHVVPPL